MSGVCEVAVESALLQMDTEEVHLFATRKSFVGEKLWVGYEKAVPERCAELLRWHCEGLSLRDGSQPCAGFLAL